MLRVLWSGRPTRVLTPPPVPPSPLQYDPNDPNSDPSDQFPWGT